jgi:hypothetical protein
MFQRILFVLVSVLTFVNLDIKAQYEYSAFNLTGLAAATPFARDYQTLTINPGNLDMETGYEQRRTSGLFDFTFSAYTELLNRRQMIDGITGKARNIPLTYSEQLDKVDELTMKPTAIDADFMTFGTSIQTKNAGTFAFSMRDRVDFYSRIDRDLTELLWMGNQSSYFDSLIVQAASGADSIIARPENFDPAQYAVLAAPIKQLVGNSEIGFSWYREFNLGYGKRIIDQKNFKAYLGLAGKYLMGQGIIQLSGADGQAFSSLSPVFKLNYTLVDSLTGNPSSLAPDAPALQPVGQGFGFDAGGTLLIKDQFIINAAINDIGQMKWNGNVYELGEGKITNIDGIGIESEDIVSTLNTFNGLDALLKWKGEESRSARLNTTARIGIGYEKLQKIRIGLDIITPMNDNKANLQRTAVNAGIEYSPWPWIHIQTGISEGGNYGLKMPAGLYFTAAKGRSEFGLATRDLLSFFKDNNPTISMALGFLRFRY